MKISNENIVEIFEEKQLLDPSPVFKKIAAKREELDTLFYHARMPRDLRFDLVDELKAVLKILKNEPESPYQISYAATEYILENQKLSVDPVSILENQREWGRLFKQAGLPDEYVFKCFIELQCAVLVLKKNPLAKFHTEKEILDHYLDIYLTDHFGPGDAKNNQVKEDCLKAYRTIAKHDPFLIKISYQEIEELFKRKFPGRHEYFSELIKQQAIPSNSLKFWAPPPLEQEGDTYHFLYLGFKNYFAPSTSSQQPQRAPTQNINDDHPYLKRMGIGIGLGLAVPGLIYLSFMAAGKTEDFTKLFGPVGEIGGTLGIGAGLGFILGVLTFIKDYGMNGSARNQNSYSADNKAETTYGQQTQ